MATGLLAGCTTTQHEAARIQLNSARERAAQQRTRVSAPNPSVPATIDAVIGRAPQTAIVVTVTNQGRRAVTDLPISVGYRTSTGGLVYLNGEADGGGGYYESHLTAIRPGRSLAWVYATRRAIPAAAKLFAWAGTKPAVPAVVDVSSLPLGVELRQNADGVLRVHLSNGTSVPQYDLQLYAYATRAGRYVAAGNATITDLGAGSTATVDLHLIGDSAGANVRIAAAPTILQ